MPYSPKMDYKQLFRRKLVVSLVLLFCFLSLIIVLFINPRFKTIAFRSIAKGTFNIVSDSDTIFTFGMYGVEKLDYTNIDSPLLLAQNDEMCSNFNLARSGAIYNDYLYVASRCYWGGTEENDTPKIRARFETKSKDLRLNHEGFDSVVAYGNIVADELGKPNMSYGVYSARFIVGDENCSDNQSSFYLIKNNDEIKETANISFWINVDSLLLSNISVPILGIDNKIVCCIQLCSNDDDSYRIRLCGDSKEYESKCTFQYSQWYNIKTVVSEKVISLFYRNIECGEWEQLISIPNQNIYYNQVMIGIQTRSPNTKVFIDDYYYDIKNIDNVSYINGSLSVLRKSDLKTLNRYYSDIKMINVKICGKILFVTGLYGFNIYNISNPISPKLIYRYRHSSFKEYQDVDFFNKDGRLYAVFTLFAEGIAIWDVTNPSEPKQIVEIPLTYPLSNGDVLPHGLQTFNLIIDFPYVYSTIGPLYEFFETENDVRGIIIYDLSEFPKVSSNIVRIPEKYWYSWPIGDCQPTYVCKYLNKLYTNFSNNGIACFDITTRSNPIFIGLKDISAFDVVLPVTVNSKGVLFTGSYYWNRIYTSYIDN